MKKISSVKLIQNILSILALSYCFVFSSVVFGQNKVVVVPLFDSSPTGVAAVPVYCPRTSISLSTGQIFNCFRSDTRVSVNPVPAGHFLFITDVVVTNNTIPNPGSGASITVGRDTGTTFPSEPTVRIDTVFPESNHVKFSTPYVVLRESERLRVAHNGNVNGLSSVVVNVYASGYLVKASSFGR